MKAVVLTLLLLLTAARAHDEAPPVDVMDTLPDDAPPPMVHRDPDPRWITAAVDLENACHDGTPAGDDGTEYVPCLARRVDDKVHQLSDVPGVMCTLSSLVDDNHVPVCAHTPRAPQSSVHVGGGGPGHKKRD